ncbi:ComEA family DNA-binding protein [Actinomadura fibrosa]|uniref:Helix-hairpin-helix domain-containing protein n=1 Tax=Actinomadura fibrosa TaxID=111802 RepID=A0ABW2XP16_9ACTN|nr:ComEA family DNA-binding protein [Actinomadura fibrosa]
MSQERLQTLADRLRTSTSTPAATPRPNVRILVLVGVVACLAAAGYLWAARPRPAPAPAPATNATLATDPTPAAGTPVGSTTGTSVVVHVLGKVKHPGVITLPPGSRVAEAIKAAGGVRPGNDTGTLNLARKIVDGEQIPVGIRPPSPTPPSSGAPPPTPGTSASTALDLNAATAEQLDQLPGVGPVLAQRIVDYRTQHGAFRSVDQLQEVNGIGARRFADLKAKVHV